MAKPAEPFSPTNEERELMLAALDQAIASARRGQNTAKQPEFKELFRANEAKLSSLKLKI